MDKIKKIAAILIINIGIVVFLVLIPLVAFDFNWSKMPFFYALFFGTLIFVFAICWALAYLNEK